MLTQDSGVKSLTAVWVHVASKNVYRCTRCNYVIPVAEVTKTRTCPGCGSSMRKAGGGPKH